MRFVSRGLKGGSFALTLIYSGMLILLCLFQLYFFGKWLGLFDLLLGIAILPAAHIAIRALVC